MTQLLYFPLPHGLSSSRLATSTKVKGRSRISFSWRPLLCLHRLPGKLGDGLEAGEVVTSFPGSLLQVRCCMRQKPAVPLAWRSGRGHAPSSLGCS